jgi:hypothetical protein
MLRMTPSAYRRPDRRTPDCDQLKRLIAKGLTQQQMADWTLENLGNFVTRSAIGQAIHRCGLEPLNGRGRYFAELPWTVRSEHLQHEYPKRLRYLGRENAGKPLKPDEAAMLRKFKAKLDALGASVWYDEGHPKGFNLTPRRDGETYVRYPDDWDGPRI